MVNILGYTAGSALSTSVERRGPMGPQGRAGTRGERGPAGERGKQGEQGHWVSYAEPADIILQPDGGLQTNDSGLSLSPMKILWSDSSGASIHGQTYGLNFSIKDFRYIIATVLRNDDLHIVKTALLIPQALQFGQPPGYADRIIWRVIDANKAETLILTFSGAGHRRMTTQHRSGLWSLYCLHGQE